MWLAGIISHWVTPGRRCQPKTISQETGLAYVSTNTVGEDGKEN